jgi:hypothetical protein
MLHRQHRAGKAVARRGRWAPLSSHEVLV